LGINSIFVPGTPTAKFGWDRTPCRRTLRSAIVCDLRVYIKYILDYECWAPSWSRFIGIADRWLSHKRDGGCRYFRLLFQPMRSPPLVWSQIRPMLLGDCVYMHIRCRPHVNCSFALVIAVGVYTSVLLCVCVVCSVACCAARPSSCCYYPRRRLRRAGEHINHQPHLDALEIQQLRYSNRARWIVSVEIVGFRHWEINSLKRKASLSYPAHWSHWSFSLSLSLSLCVCVCCPKTVHTCITTFGLYWTKKTVQTLNEPEGEKQGHQM